MFALAGVAPQSAQALSDNQVNSAFGGLGTPVINAIVPGTTPVVSLFTTATSSPSNASSIAYSLTFTGSVTGLTTSDFTVGGTATGWSVSSVGGSGASYTVNLSRSGGTDGTLTVTLNQNSVDGNCSAPTVQAAVGCLGPAANYASTSSMTSDQTKATVSSFTTAEASPSKANSISYSLTFSEAVTGLTTADFSLGGGASGMSVSSVIGTGSSYTVTVTRSGGSDGTLTLALNANTVSDLAGNTSPVAQATATTSMTTDQTKPTVSNFSTSEETPTVANTYTYSITFSESVTGFTTDDITLGGTSTNWVVSSVTGSGAGPYVVRLSRGVSSPVGTLTITLNSNSVSDAAGNVAPASSANPTNGTMVVQNGTSFIKVVAGDKNTCALRTGGTVACWGGNQWGQTGFDRVDNGVDHLGTGNSSKSTAPVVITTDGTTPLSGASDVAVGGNHACAARSNGTVYCWGANYVWQLGRGGGTDTSANYTAAAVTGISTAKKVTSSDNYTCALLADTTAKCWGNNNFPLLGGWQTAQTSTPVTVEVSSGVSLTGIKDIALGSNHACALMTDKTVKCWGSDQYGQIGDNAAVNASAVGPTAVSGITNAKVLDAGTYTSCAVLETGYVKCWGQGESGALGNGSLTNAYTPVTMRNSDNTADLGSVTGLATGASLTCVVMNDKTTKCMGDVQFGSTGRNVRTGGNCGTIIDCRPVTVWNNAGDSSPLAGTTQISSTYHHTCATGPGGAIKCWGEGTSYQLGDYQSAFQPAPVGVRVAKAGPIISSFAPGSSGALTNASSVTYTLSFDKTITNLTKDDLVVGGTSTGWTVSSVSGSGSGPYTITVGGSGQTPGSLYLTLQSGGIADEYGVLGPNLDYLSDEVTVTSPPPAVLSFAAEGSTPTNSRSLTYKISFDVSVTGLATGDFSFGGTGSGWSVASVSGTGAGPYTVTVTGPSATEGSVILKLAANSVAEATSIQGPTALQSAAAVVLDTTAPAQAVLSGAPSGSTTATGASIGYTAEDGATVTCKLDGGSYSACGASPKVLSGLSDGSHTFYVKVTDAAGNATTVDATWTVDTSAPSAPVISSQPSSLANSTSASVAFSAEANATVTCQLDGGSFTACGSSPKSLTGLSEGVHTLVIKATDAAGNVSPTSTINWTVDTTKASVSSFAPTTDGPTNTDSATYSLTFSEPVTGLSTGDFTVGGTASGWTVTGLSGSGAGTYTVTLSRQPGGSDGTVTLGLGSGAVSDAAGNASPAAAAPATGSKSFDATAPTLTEFKSVVTSPSSSSSVTYSITFDEAISGLTTGDFTVGGTATGWTVTGVTGSGAGPYTVTVTRGTPSTDGTVTVDFANGAVTDRAGNTINGGGTTATGSLTVDSIPPSVPALSGSVASNSTKTSETFTFSGDPGTTFTCVVDGTPKSCTSPFTMDHLADGAHTFRVVSVDAAGNQSSDIGYSWVVDTRAPGAPTFGSKPTSGTDSTSARFTFGGATGGETYECSLDSGAWVPCTSPRNVTGLAVGDHDLQVRTVDPAGNRGVANTFMWSIGPVPLTPPAGTVGPHITGEKAFSVDGATHFRAGHFVLNPVWPNGARKVIVSNTRDFANSETFNVGSSINWRNPLALSGTAGSKPVYIKFIGNRNVDPNTVYTANFRWDLAEPYLKMAARKAGSFKKGAWNVRLRGGDTGTGIHQAQFWMKKGDFPTNIPVTIGPGFVAPFADLITVPGDFNPIWVRVMDEVGNWSQWYFIR